MLGWRLLHVTYHLLHPFHPRRHPKCLNALKSPKESCPKFGFPVACSAQLQSPAASILFLGELMTRTAPGAAQRCNRPPPPTTTPETKNLDCGGGDCARSCLGACLVGLSLAAQLLLFFYLLSTWARNQELSNTGIPNTLLNIYCCKIFCLENLRNIVISIKSQLEDCFASS